MRRRLVPLAITAALPVLFVLVTSVTTHGKPACSNATLQGRYSVRATGDVIGAGPLALVGVFRFDGNGGVAASVTTRVNGVNTQSVVEGVYLVNSDCSVDDKLTAPNGAVSTHRSVIFDNGNGFFILNTTEGAPNVIIGEGRKQLSRRMDAGDDR